MDSHENEKNQSSIVNLTSDYEFDETEDNSDSNNSIVRIIDLTNMEDTNNKKSPEAIKRSATSLSSSSNNSEFSSGGFHDSIDSIFGTPSKRSKEQDSNLQEYNTLSCSKISKLYEQLSYQDTIPQLQSRTHQ